MSGGDDHDVHMLRILPNLDNIKNVGKKMGFADLVVQIHNHCEVDLGKEGLSLADLKKGERGPASLRKLQDHLKVWFKISSSSFLLMFQLAKTVGPEWELLEKIMLGNVPEQKAKEGEKPKPFEIPTSAHPFTALAKVPPEKRLQLLQSLLDREISLKEFRLELKKKGSHSTPLRCAPPPRSQ